MATKQPAASGFLRHAEQLSKHQHNITSTLRKLSPRILGTNAQNGHSQIVYIFPVAARHMGTTASKTNWTSIRLRLHSKFPVKLHQPGRFSTAASGKVKPKQAGSMHNVDAATLAKAHKLSVPVGLLAGVFGSFVGVGGGVLIVPLLTGACKALPQRLVSGTSLVAVVSTALASSYTYLSHGVVDIAAALLISCCAVLTAPLGANLTATLNALALKKILGYFLVAVAFLVPLKSVLFENRAKSTASEHALEVQNKPALQASPGISFSHLTESALTGLKQMSWTTTILLGLTGATAGVASGLLGIGGGTVVTPLLAMMTPLSQAGVLGSSLLAMVAPSCVGLGQHARLGNVDWRMAAGLAAGTAVGSFAGSKVAVDAPAGVLEGIFSIGMLFLGWRTLSGARTAMQKVVVAQHK